MSDNKTIQLNMCSDSSFIHPHHMVMKAHHRHAGEQPHRTWKEWISSHKWSVLPHLKCSRYVQGIERYATKLSQSGFLKVPRRNQSNGSWKTQKTGIIHIVLYFLQGLPHWGSIGWERTANMTLLWIMTGFSWDRPLLYLTSGVILK